MDWLNNKEYLEDMMHEMLKSNELTDVTLVCNDNKQFKAHKIVLIACSSLFKNIFNELPQNNLVIQLIGVKHQEIESILELMYLGSTTFHPERKNDLLSLAKNLEIKEISCGAVLPGNEIFVDHLNIDSKASYDSEHVISKADNGNHQEEKFTNSDERNDNIEEFLNCDQCESQFEGKGNLENHILTYHNKSKYFGDKYPCNQCQYEATQKSSLIRHIQSIHEGLRYNCNQCNYTAKLKDILRIHIKSKHLGIKYCCNLCQYEATEKRILKRHMQSTHEGVANVNI